MKPWVGKELVVAKDFDKNLVKIPFVKVGHVAVAGRTGLGKTNFYRVILPQMCTVADVHYISPAFADHKANGDDWSEVHRMLASEPATTPEDVKVRLTWACNEVTRRAEAERAGDFSWADKRIYIVFDEYQDIVLMCPDTPKYVAKLLSTARQYEVFLVMAATNFLINTIGGNSGARDAYWTVVYVGGDPTTCSALLGRTLEYENELKGEGLVVIKSLTSSELIRGRVPYASNEAIKTLLSKYPDKEKITFPALKDMKAVFPVTRQRSKTAED